MLDSGNIDSAVSVLEETSVCAVSVLEETSVCTVSVLEETSVCVYVVSPYATHLQSILLLW